jgi:hypothetical protein
MKEGIYNKTNQVIYFNIINWIKALYCNSIEVDI